MDELDVGGSDPSRSEKNLQNTRVTRVCARCRRKKIKCDFKLPSCSQCETADVSPCMGFDRASGREIPRSIVTYLENRVAELELELEGFGSSVSTHDAQVAANIGMDDMSLRPLIVGDSLATVLADVVRLEDRAYRRAFHKIFQTPSSLPLPISRQGTFRAPEMNADAPVPTDLAQVPRVAGDYMLKNYTDIHLPQYPCVYEPELHQIYNRCYDERSTLTPFELFIVSIAMAISAGTLIWKDNESAHGASAGFWAQAKNQLALIDKHETPIQALQVALLLTHYGFTNPAAVDVFYCIGEASRMCIHLGLHKDPPKEVQVNPLHLDERRRLFWTMQGMERAVCYYLRVPPSMPDAIITSAMPSPLADSYITEHGLLHGPHKKASALHFWTFRLLETEVYRALWMETEPSDQPFEVWVDDVLKRLQEWYDKAVDFALAQQIEFRDVQLHFMRVRIHRPTPRNMNPSHAFYLNAITSSIRLAEEYCRQLEKGRLFYPWHAVHICFESLVVLATAVWRCIDWLEEKISAKDIQTSVDNYMTIFTKIDDVWPGVQRCVPMLTALIKPVMHRLELLQYGLRVDSATDTMSQRFDIFLFPEMDDKEIERHQKTGLV